MLNPQKSIGMTSRKCHIMGRLQNNLLHFVAYSISFGCTRHLVKMADLLA